jgi:protein TonB
MTAVRHLGGIARWGACLVLVLGAHAAAAVVLLTHWHAPADAVASAPPILIDLAPAPAAPAIVASQLPPGPVQPQSQAQPAPEKKIEKADIAPKPEEPVQKPETNSTPEQPVEKALQAKPLPAPQKTVMLAMLPPPHPHIKTPPHEKRRAKAEPRSQRANMARAPSAAERHARRTAALSPGVSRHDSDALPNWKSRLLAQLERYKRYPPEAQQRGEEGVAQLAFSIDRSGGVHNAHIVHSSGSALLDRATLALVQRAQPLPPPPAELGGQRISIVVPIRYNIR